MIKVLRTLDEGGVLGQTYPGLPGVANFRQKLALRTSRLLCQLPLSKRRKVQRIRLVVACRRAERHSPAHIGS